MSNFCCTFAADLEKEVSMQVAINNTIYNQAQVFARQKGQDISSMLERYLLLFIQRNNDSAKETVPDVVAGLLGAGKKIEDDDINGRQAYTRYLEEKYQ